MASEENLISFVTRHYWKDLVSNNSRSVVVVVGVVVVVVVVVVGRVGGLNVGGLKRDAGEGAAPCGARTGGRGTWAAGLGAAGAPRLTRGTPYLMYRLFSSTSTRETLQHTGELSLL